MSAYPPIAPIGAQAAMPLPPDDLAASDFARASVAGMPTSGPTFGQMVTQGINAVDAQLKVGEAGLQRLATGEVQNLHQLMTQLEESRLSFQLMMQVRNRLLEAYQDVMKMQV